MTGEQVQQLFQHDELTTKEQILDAAISLMARKGFEAVSIREIAREVGIRESSIYNHFKSKDEILDTIIDYFLGEISRSSPDFLPTDALLAKYGPEEFMNLGARTYLEMINKPRIAKIWRLLSIEISHNQKIRMFFKKGLIEIAIKSWEDMFGQMMALGYIKKCDTQTLAREFFYYCVYLLFDYFIISFNDSTYCTFTEDMLQDLAVHIKFIAEAIKVPEAS